jgi:hypothetical protein
MRAKIQYSIDYHLSMQEFYQKADEAQKKIAAAPVASHGTSGASSGAHGAARHEEPPKPKQSANEKLAEMHGDVAKQLTDLLEADPPVSGIDRARTAQRPLRNVGANLKPNAGVYH